MEIQRAIELLEKSERIGIITAPEPDLDCLASAEVLAQTLETQGKQVGFLIPCEKALIPHPELFPKVVAGTSLPREFIVSLDISSSPISQLRYEKGDGRLDIIISPKASAVRKEHVSFDEGRVQCDCAFVLGMADIEKAVITGLDPEFLTETPLINIDISAGNKKYGEVNLVDEQKSSLGEMIYELITNWREAPAAKDAATLLLAGIVSRTHCFRSPQTSADALLAASELKRLGADHALALELAQGGTDLALTQLLGRASVRSKLDQERGILWSFLTPEDFEKTGRSVKDVPAALERLRQEFPPHRLLAFLWQEPVEKGVHTILAGDKGILERVASRAAGEFQSPNFKLSDVFPSFRDAEERVSALLGEAL